MKKEIIIKDKLFELFLPEDTIKSAIKVIADKMNVDLADKDPLFLCVLNGSFMFAAELMKYINIPCEITFVRVASYKGVTSSGKLKEIYGLEEEIEGRTIVIIEDIVDTGYTMSLITDQLACENPREIKVATLLFKPNALAHSLELDYVALEIPNDFIVGYGLDYNGYGRNLTDIYKIKK